MNYLFVFIGLILFLILFAALFMYRAMFVATRGRKIIPYPNPRKALLVLDLQEGYEGNNPRQPATSPAPGTIFFTVNRIIEWAESKGIEVVYVRQVFSNNFFVRMHGGRRLNRVIVDRRIKKINDNDFAKNRTDAFSNRQLEQFMIDNCVNELIITGVDAAYCVLYTAVGGINRGYKVTVVRDAVRSRDDMATVEIKYRKKGISCISSKELIDSYESMEKP